MEWLTSATQVYHRPCTAWTAVKDGTRCCSACGVEIPAAILTRAAATPVQSLEDLRARTQAISQKLAALRAPPKIEDRLPPVRPARREPGSQ